jgi:hypothetical protein
LRPHYAHKLVEISKYSNICRFVHQLREPFLKAFEWHKDDFPQVNGDAFYIGTVMQCVGARRTHMRRTHAGRGARVPS